MLTAGERAPAHPQMTDSFEPLDLARRAEPALRQATRVAVSASRGRAAAVVVAGRAIGAVDGDGGRITGEHDISQLLGAARRAVPPGDHAEPRAAAAVAQPIHIDGRQIGALCVYRPDPVALADGAAEMVADAANAVARELEQALRRRALRLTDIDLPERMIVEAIQDGVIVVDDRGTIRACNPAAERILGLSADQIAGRAAADPRWTTTGPDGRPMPPEQRPVQRTLATGQSVEQAVLGVERPGGAVAWLSLTTRLVPGDGAAPLVLACFTDITPLLQAEAERDAHRREREAHRELADLMLVGAAQPELLDAAAFHASALVAGPRVVIVEQRDDAGPLVVACHTTDDRAATPVGESASAADAEMAAAAIARREVMEFPSDHARARFSLAAPIETGAEIWGALIVCDLVAADPPARLRARTALFDIAELLSLGLVADVRTHGAS